MAAPSPRRRVAFGNVYASEVACSGRVTARAGLEPGLVEQSVTSEDLIDDLNRLTAVQCPVRRRQRSPRRAHLLGRRPAGSHAARVGLTSDGYTSGHEARSAAIWPASSLEAEAVRLATGAHATLREAPSGPRAKLAVR